MCWLNIKILIHLIKIKGDKKMKRFIGLLIALILCVQGIFAQGLISAKELAKIMNDKNVKIVSARKLTDYNIVHITGAINIWHKDLYKAGEVKGVLKSSAELAKIFGKKGISEKNTIVIYDSGSNKAAGRLYWIFDYLGCDNVKILNGHMKSWRAARGKVTKIATKITPTTFNASVDKQEIATTAYVKQNLNKSNVAIVDVRSKDEYDGIKGKTTRKGHISGAIHFEYKKVFNAETGKLKSKEELTKLFNTAGITSNKEIILYCETSVRAGIVYLALKYKLNYPKVKVYDGALYEWAATASNPLK